MQFLVCPPKVLQVVNKRVQAWFRGIVHGHNAYTADDGMGYAGGHRVPSVGAARAPGGGSCEEMSKCTGQQPRGVSMPNMFTCFRVWCMCVGHVLSLLKWWPRCMC